MFCAIVAVSPEMYVSKCFEAVLRFTSEELQDDEN